MRYILLVNDHVEPEELQDFLDRIVGPQAKDTIMTAGERLIAQGIQQGVQQGIQQGVQQGECGLFLRLLRKRFGAQVDSAIEQRVENASAEQIAIWADRVLSASSLTALMAD